MKSNILIILFLFLVSTISLAGKNEKYFHVYGAGGELISLGSVRIGHEDWEFGLLNQRSIGFNKLNYNEEYYNTFGFLINQNSSVGVFAGVGVEYEFWKIFSFRCEANVSYAVDNFSHAAALVGLTIFI